MEYKGNYWLTISQMGKYQSMVSENPCIQLEVVKTLNPVALLPVDLGPCEHDCLEVISSWPYLTNQPISNLDVEDFIHSSSFV
jgi:hypothetical protein